MSYRRQLIVLRDEKDPACELMKELPRFWQTHTARSLPTLHRVSQVRDCGSYWSAMRNSHTDSLEKDYVAEAQSPSQHRSHNESLCLSKSMS